MKPVELITMVRVPFRGRYELLTRDEASALRNQLGSALAVYTNSVESIVDCVCAFYQLPKQDLFSRRRMDHIAFPRQVAMYLCRKLTNKSLTSVGEHFDRDHGTVIHACHVIAGRMDVDPKFAEDIREIKLRIKNTADAIPQPKAA